MGTGKSSVGRRLAASRGWPRLDTDAMIATAVGMRISDIFERLGEERFREEEIAILETIDPAEPAVIITGGGAILCPENRARLHELGTVFCLTAELGTLLERLGRRTDRPLLRRRTRRRESRICSASARRSTRRRRISPSIPPDSVTTRWRRRSRIALPAPLETKAELVRRALAIGFDDCRIARAESPAHAGEFREWLERGAAGEMDWIARAAEKRCDPELVLPGARSVVVLAMSYFQGEGRTKNEEGRSGAPDASLSMRWGMIIMRSCWGSCASWKGFSVR